MRRILNATLFVLVALGLAAPVIRAQENETPPEVANDAKPYVPSPAWKSVEIANYYLKRKKYNAALSRYREAVKTDPYYAPGYLGLGKVYEKIGLKQKSLEAYQKYLDALPSTKEADEAKEVHQAIARLERDLKLPQAPRRAQSSRADASSQPH